MSVIKRAVVYGVARDPAARLAAEDAERRGYRVYWAAPHAYKLGQAVEADLILVRPGDTVIAEDHRKQWPDAEISVYLGNRREGAGSDPAPILPPEPDPEPAPTTEPEKPKRKRKAKGGKS